MKKEIIKSGVVAMHNDKYWGIQYEDGLSATRDFGPIENAEVSNPEFCRKPEHKTYAADPHIEKLRKAKLVPIKITTIYEVEET